MKMGIWVCGWLYRGREDCRVFDSEVDAMAYASKIHAQPHFTNVAVWDMMRPSQPRKLGAA